MMFFRASARRLTDSLSRLPKTNSLSRHAAHRPNAHHLSTLSGFSQHTHASTTTTNATRTFSSEAQITNPAMFCRQCEQTQDHTACRSVGICGKTAETSAMQDGLVHLLKSMGVWAVAARDAGANEKEMYEVNWWTLRSAFSTLTNVNFDEERIAEVRHALLDLTCWLAC